MSTKKVILPPSTLGVWSVTTEGDEEGRSVRQLGAYVGHFDDVALHLADKAYYGLRMKYSSQHQQTLRKTGSEVQVSFDIDTGTWDQTTSERAESVRKWLQANGRTEVRIEDGQFYASVKLQGARTPTELKRLADKIERDNLLSRLTDREKELLGVK